MGTPEDVAAEKYFTPPEKQCTKDTDCEYKVGAGSFYYCLAPESIDCHHAEPIDEEARRRFTADVFTTGSE